MRFPWGYRLYDRRGLPQRTSTCTGTVYAATHTQYPRVLHRGKKYRKDHAQKPRPTMILHSPNIDSVFALEFPLVFLPCHLFKVNRSCRLQHTVGIVHRVELVATKTLNCSPWLGVPRRYPIGLDPYFQHIL